ncbi:MAG: hypothetical protein DDT27_01187 [Dehalococcoidia bacterium]|nr:hypothetical protein [Chloroflexota bacterium]
MQEGGIIVVTIPPLQIRLGETEVVEFEFKVRKRNDPTRTQRVTALTSISKLALPPEGIEDGSVWIMGDLHIHSKYSECQKPSVPRNLFDLYHIRDSLQPRGYRFIYMTDHVGSTTGRHLQRTVCLCPTGTGFPLPCGVANTWQCYVTNTQRATMAQIALFPGAEVTAWHATNQHGGGHALIYGANNLVRRDGVMLFCNQLTGPDLVRLAPGSSLAIAHPMGTVIGGPWEHLRWLYDIRGYRGVELITPKDWDHTLASSETQWWMARAFTTEALSDAVAGRGVLSVRTGSDWHGFWGEAYAEFGTHVLIPVALATWQSEPWSTRRHRVDDALHAGHTIAAHRRGWGRVTVNNVMPGGVVRNIPSVTTLNFNIRFIPSVTGTYTISVFRNNLTGTPEFRETVSGTAGVEITRNFTRSFPGGTHGYWFYVEGADHIYSTPVIVTSSP